MRNKRLFKNLVASLAFQVTTVICGFILPRVVLGAYGSEVNGLVNSITQFLQIISFLEFGVGAVVQSSLYKPLAEKDNVKISQIIVSANSFFKKLAKILVIYIFALIVFYPLVADTSFDFIYTAILILSISISAFSQYYFGVVERLLLTADQRGYIQYNAQTLSLALNTLACFVLIKLGASIHLVKLISSLIFLLRPWYLRIYVKKHYSINRKIRYETEPIEQKWNGVAQHIAAVVLDGTDNVILTIFASLSDVSIYSVYHLVVYGVKQLFTSTISGIQPLMGELWAKQEKKALLDYFGWIEWVIHTSVVFIFSCAGVLIVPFIEVYTYGINDANYLQPVFGMLIVLAHACHCIRLPYNIMILAAGHYKQTQNNYIIAAILNVVISIVGVMVWGLVGVAIGTIVAMVYQTLWMVYYNFKYLVERPRRSFYKQIGVDILTILISIIVTRKMHMQDISYISWVMMACSVAIVIALMIILLNCVFYNDKMKRIFAVIKR